MVEREVKVDGNKRSGWTLDATFDVRCIADRTESVCWAVVRPTCRMEMHDMHDFTSTYVLPLGPRWESLCDGGYPGNQGAAATCTSHITQHPELRRILIDLQNGKGSGAHLR